MIHSNIKIKERRYAGFFGKCCLFLVILKLLDFGIGSLLQSLYFKQDSGLLYRSTYALDSTKADVLVFGASSANHHYYPDEFENHLQQSFYNAGRDGNAIFYHYAILEGVLRRYTPKVVLLDVCRKEFKADQDSYDRISSLLPYYYSHREMKSIVALKSPFEKYKFLSNIYPYNSLLFTIGIGNAGFNRGRSGGNDLKGYVPLTNIFKKPAIEDSNLVKYEIDSVKIKYFQSFIEACINRHIAVYVIFSPYFIHYKYEDASVEIAMKIAKAYKIPAYNFSNDISFVNNAALFADECHLNDNGAKIFSSKVSERIILGEPSIRRAGNYTANALNK